MPCGCGQSFCPECMGGYRPSEQPFEAAYRSALERIKELEAQSTALRGREQAQDPPATCEHCDQPLTCNAKLVEETSGLHHSLHEAWTRAEKAEAQLAAVEARHAVEREGP